MQVFRRKTCNRKTCSVAGFSAERAVAPLQVFRRKTCNRSTVAGFSPKNLQPKNLLRSRFSAEKPCSVLIATRSIVLIAQRSALRDQRCAISVARSAHRRLAQQIPAGSVQPSWPKHNEKQRIRLAQPAWLAHWFYNENQRIRLAQPAWLAQKTC